MKNTLFSLEDHKAKFDFNALQHDYYRLQCWGLTTALDLKSCNPEFIRAEECIKKYIYELCDLIEMKRFGEPLIISFGENIAVSGYSLTQLIETSLISGHFANHVNGAFIDIFSCKVYNPVTAAIFTQKYFEAKSCKMGYLFRD